MRLRHLVRVVKKQSKCCTLVQGVICHFFPERLSIKWITFVNDLTKRVVYDSMSTNATLINMNVNSVFLWAISGPDDSRS